VPQIITENGIVSPDTVGEDGKVNDTDRTRYIQEYLGAMKRAMAEGVPVKGYMHWSFMDNFEWAEGYSQRFGLVHTDFETLKRTPKESAYFYRDTIAQKGANIQHLKD